MSSLAFLVTELQSLSSETKRRHPDVREAAEKSLAILRSSPEQATADLALDGPQSDDLLRPVFMGCGTRNAKIVAISLGSLQRLIALKAVPQSAIPLIITTMGDCMSQGVDIQLRILQTLLSLITNCPTVHGPLLGDALLLCFKLQESRIAVVSSTAAATLRQLLMFVVDKVVDEDRQENIDTSSLTETTLPDGTQKLLGPSAGDAFSVFEDLCLLAISDQPHFLKLDSLPKTFALELIESVLTNYHNLFREHSELLLLIQHHLCPLLLRMLSDRPVFALTLRATRVVFLLLKQFLLDLTTECEVFLMLIIRTVGDGDSTAGAENTFGSRPQWMRVLSMEIIRGLCSDADLMRSIWTKYDSHPDAGSKVFSSLITALNRLITEKPALLGIGSQMSGVGSISASDTGSNTALSGSTSGYGLDVGGVAGMVANAASATVSGVVGMMASGTGLSTTGSAMKLQCIDQLDKADSPPIPESYIYLLALQCLVSLCEGFAAVAGPLYSSIAIQRPKAAGDGPVRAPPALDLSTLPQDDPGTTQLQSIHDMIENGWPGLLAALSFIIATNLSEELFADVLTSYQSMANVAGMLGLATPRDAFLTSLARFAVPTKIVSSLESYSEPMTPRSSGVLSADNLGLTALAGGVPVTPGLSERNMACLKVLISSALFLAGSLGSSWFHILEALQNADYVLTAKRSKQGSGKRNPSGSVPISQRSASGPQPAVAAPGGPPAPRHPLLADLDTDNCLSAIRRLFDATKNLEDPAFKDFVTALCKLSSEMVGMQSDSAKTVLPEQSDAPAGEDASANAHLTTGTEQHHAHRRRVSGIHLPRTLRTGDFGISRLGGVALLNVHRLIYRSPDVAWDIITSHLLSVIRHPPAPQPIRVQAAEILDEILVLVPRNLTTASDLQPKVQRRVLDVLALQIVLDNGAGVNSTGIELRRMGLATLHSILQSSGHTLVVGWETIFEMLGSVCKLERRPSLYTESESSAPTSPATPRASRPPPLGYVNEKGYVALVKIAFQSLTLVCDSLPSLSPDNLRLCISTIGSFGRQADTNIALTAAASLLWGVSDAIQAKRKDIEKEPEYSALWMFLLLEVLGLCADERPEVRGGAIQTLFRTLQLYGATLSLDTWEECIWKVTFPLIDCLTVALRQNTSDLPSSPDEYDSTTQTTEAWADSKTLALQSIGSIFYDFLTSKIIQLVSFEKAWDAFVGYIQDSFLFDPRAVSAAALRSLEKAVKASGTAATESKASVRSALERTWTACDEMGAAVLQRARTQLDPKESSESSQPHSPFTQDSLVAFVDLIRTTRHVSFALDGEEWSLTRLKRLMMILKGTLTYPNSVDYRPDIDALTPVQAVVMEAIRDIDLSVPGAPSLVLCDLSEYTTLAFVASFDIVDDAAADPPNSPARPKRAPKRVTYIALTKKTLPMLVELFLKFKERIDIYVDGTLEAVLSAYAVPIKLKYDCPAPSKFGKEELPLWKVATTNFLRVMRECASQMKTLNADIPDDRVEGIWRQVIDVFRGGILADCSAAESFPLDVQEAEENFDLALIASLEIDVVPLLGDARVPDYLVTQLAQVLHRGSRLHEFGDDQEVSPVSQASKNGHDESKVSAGTLTVNGKDNVGTTESRSLLPRERFSYWCFDLLFLLCSDQGRDQEVQRRRVASLSIPSLLNRCQTTLNGYIADESLRGNLPFPRAREEELLYVLRKLHRLQLWSGTFWAAFSDFPSKYAVDLPVFDPATPSRSLIADAIKRSPRAHLFHFFVVLTDIASIPRRTPSAWVMDELSPPDSRENHGNGNEKETVSDSHVGAPKESGSAVELDARQLARSCLKQIGKEMGLSH